VLAQRVYLLDGSRLQLEHEPELVQAFPPASGRRKHQPWVYLFTTWSQSAEDAMELSGCRWGIETDLRGCNRKCAFSAYRGSVRRPDGKRIAGCCKGLQPGACDHVPCCTARQNRLMTVELHLCPQYCARWLSQSPGRPQPPTAKAGTGTDHRLDRPMPTSQTQHPPLYPREVWGRGYRFPIRRREKLSDIAQKCAPQY